MLARVASPQARSAIRRYPGWDIWDQEDISRKIRSLSKEEQRKIVDLYFPGQRLALIGEPEPGPWQTIEQFFAPFSGKRSAFTHAWSLVGRISEVDRLKAAINDPSAVVINLVGSGGAGKSRIIREAIPRSSALVRFLSPTEAITSRSLDDLGHREKLLVVDDAHDRKDLQILFQYAANEDNRTKLILSFRPYGRDYILNQAGRFALTAGVIREVTLEALTLQDSKQLAEQVLTHFGGPQSAAEDIARLTRDCPLATVLGAQVVAKHRRHVELLKDEDLFRTTLIGKFSDVIAGSIGDTADELPIKRILTVLALVQPFALEDTSLLSLIQKVHAIREEEAARLMRLLYEGGVLFKRGGLYRLSPDLLADYIIEKECVGVAGKSTGFAERVFDASDGKHFENIVLNLGKLDWRRADADPDRSRLLDGVWTKLKPTEQYGDPHLKAVTGVAYFQPGRALQFASDLASQQRHLNDLPPILKNVSYNMKHLRGACELLWQLGKGDGRRTNSHPHHAVRVLEELCEVTTQKPREFLDIVVDFGISLLEREDVWRGHYTPLDFLKSILATDGQESKSTNRTVTFTRFGIRKDFVAPLRDKAVAGILKLLRSSNEKAAICAARTLSTAIQYPMDGDRDPWISEFAKILRAVKETIGTHALPPVVLLEIGRSVSWHAQYGDGEPSELASEIIRNLPASLEFRTTLVLVDGHGMLLRRFDDYKIERKELAQLQDEVAGELLRRYPDPSKAAAFLSSLLAPIVRYEPSRSPHPFLHALFRLSPQLAELAVVRSIDMRSSELDQYAYLALAALLVHKPKRARELIAHLVRSASPDLRGMVGSAYTAAGGSFSVTSEDISNFRTLLSDAATQVLFAGINALRFVAFANPRERIDLVVSGNVGASAAVANEALLTLSLNDHARFEGADEKDADVFLEKIKPLPELEGHWIEEFLAYCSEHFAEVTASFFMDRVRIATETEDWKFRPCNHGPYGHVKLRFRNSNDFLAILKHVSKWLSAAPDASYVFKVRAAELYATMFAPFNDEFLAFLRDWVETANASDLVSIAYILAEMPVENNASNDFLFRESSFIFRLLERAQQFGEECRKKVRGKLFGLAISGTRSGTPGEPFPEDFSMKEKSEAIVAHAYPLRSGSHWLI